MRDDAVPHGDPAPRRIEAIVLGAGMSGLVSASTLLQTGVRRIVVVDEYAQVGGNHLDRSVNGYTFDVGSFIFQDDSPLLAHFPEILPRYVPIRPSWARLNPQGRVTRYPFSVRDDLVAAGPVEGLRILASVAWARLFRRRMRNAGDFARFWIGARLFRRAGLENYMERFCGLPADQIDLQFARSRMLWIAEYSSVRTLLRRLVLAWRSPAALEPTNTQLARPAEGFTHLYRPIVEQLTERDVTFVLGDRPTSLHRVDGEFHLDVGDRHFVADRVVSTIPIDHALDLCGLPIARRLPTVTLISLFFSFSGERGFAESILYNFSFEARWKRLTVYSDFYGRVDGREYFAVEVIPAPSASATGALSAAEAEREFREHVARNGLFDGDLRLEGSHVLTHAYPIYTGGAGEHATAAIGALREFGVESFGRQGGFVYQPTARTSTIEAEQAVRAAGHRGDLPVPDADVQGVVHGVTDRRSARE